MLFATFGVQHIKFWQTPRSGRLSQAIEGRRGAFGTEGPKIIVCAVWVARDRLVAGGNNGDVDLILDDFVYASKSISSSCFDFLCTVLFQ